MYWSPKLHKNPIKARFPIPAPNSSMRPLSRAITAALKLVYKQNKKYNFNTQYYSGAKTF